MRSGEGESGRRRIFPRKYFVDQSTLMDRELHTLAIPVPACRENIPVPFFTDCGILVEIAFQDPRNLMQGKNTRNPLAPKIGAYLGKVIST